MSGVESLNCDNQQNLLTRKEGTYTVERLLTLKDLERNVSRVSAFLDGLYRDEENNQELIRLAKSRLQTNLDTIQIEQEVRQSLLTEFASQLQIESRSFAGDIVICDAQVLFHTAHCRSNEKTLHGMGFTTCLIGPPVKHSFCCEFLEIATNRKLGNFFTRHGQPGIFLVDEALAYSPHFKRQLKNPYFTTIIKDFHGEISLHCCAAQGYLSIVGSGSRNFYSKPASN